jgi:hypothetical protein
MVGFLTKASWLKAICKGNYLSWPLINVKNVVKYFPESEETQKGHMHGQRQGVQSSKVAEPTEDAPTTLPHKKKNNILITEHEVKSLMYANQTGLFPIVSSLGNKYVMILHHVDSNSFWAEAIQNQSGGELILARTRALAWMQRRGLIPKHQILDNQASAENKAAIEASGMTYELVPPKEHQRKMAEKPFKPSRIILSESSVAAPYLCQSTYDVNTSHRSNGSSSFFDNLVRIQTYRHMHISTNTTTIIGIPLSLLALKHWSTTNSTNAAPMPNTAQKHLSWAHPPNTIDVGSFRPPQHAPRASPGQFFSNTNT